MVTQSLEEVNDIDDAPATLSAKQEIFCQEYARHGDFWRAYQVAGYLPDTTSPKDQKYNILNNPKIKHRVTILRERAMVKLDLDIGKVIQMTTEVYERSVDGGQLAVALGAAKFLGEYLGMQNPGTTKININLSSEKLEGEIVRLAKAAGVKLIGTKIVSEDVAFSEIASSRKAGEGCPSEQEMAGEK